MTRMGAGSGGPLDNPSFPCYPEHMTNARAKLIDTPYQETMCPAPDCFDVDPKAPNSLQINGTAWLRVFSSCQALMMPTKFYGATHKRCREVIREELGFCPKGKPGLARPKMVRASKSPSSFRSGGKNDIYKWLGIEALVHDRYDTNAVGGADYTLILFNHDQAGFR